METLYTSCVIRPCYSGFGEFECGEDGGDSYLYGDHVDLLWQIPEVKQVLDLSDPLSDSLADKINIKGRVHDCPDVVLAVILDDDTIEYYGLRVSE